MTSRSASRWLAALAAVLALSAAGCGDDTDDTGGVDVSDAWSRPSPMVADAGAVYMDLESDETTAVVAASVSEEIAAAVELHETATMDDMDDMDGESMDDGSADDMDEGRLHPRNRRSCALRVQPAEALNADERHPMARSAQTGPDPARNPAGKAGCTALHRQRSAFGRHVPRPVRARGGGALWHASREGRTWHFSPVG